MVFVNREVVKMNVVGDGFIRQVGGTQVYIYKECRSHLPHSGLG